VHVNLPDTGITAGLKLAPCHVLPPLAWGRDLMIEIGRELGWPKVLGPQNLRARLRIEVAPIRTQGSYGIVRVNLQMDFLDAADIVVFP
jgi:hypothetical protein